LEDKTRRRPFPAAYSVIPVAVPPRRFPPPWSVEETDACFIVRDKNGPVGQIKMLRRSEP
jgi:hypothetical protein